MTQNIPTKDVVTSNKIFEVMKYFWTLDKKLALNSDVYYKHLIEISILVFTSESE